MNKTFALATVVIRELYRRKDFYVLFVLTALITLVMASASFFKDSADGLKEISFLLIWISGLAIAVATAARQIPAERENRTIFPLLAKPVTRAHVIAGKFLGCWLACGAALLTFYSILIVISAAREHTLPVADYVQAFWMQWMFLAVVVAMVIWGSVVFAAPSSNATICIVVVAGILTLGSHLNRVAIDQSEPLRSLIYAIYFTIPHLEWFNLKDYVIYAKEIVGWGYIALASLYALAYTALFLLGAWMSFRGKALSK
jgi:Cu-processing system permease protein